MESKNLCFVGLQVTKTLALDFRKKECKMRTTFGIILSKGSFYDKDMLGSCNK